MNSSVEIEGVVADVNYVSIEKLVAGVDLILDGLDNLETRLLINDVSLKHKVPWVYGGAVSSRGMTMTIIPGQTHCFRCVFPSVPTRGVIANCDTAGVISPAPITIGALQSAEAIKILVDAEEINRDLIIIDVWQGTFNRVKIHSREGCPACQGKYEFLQKKYGIRTTILCGQNSVQVLDPNIESLSLEELALHLEPLVGEVSGDEFTLRFAVDGQEMVVFPDGRFILKDSFDESLARSFYVHYVGTFK